MRLKILSALAALLLLNACNGTLAPFPDVDLGSAVLKNNDLTQSYGYFVSWDASKNREYREPAMTLFKDKVILIHADDYGALQKWVLNTQAWAKNHCK